MCQQLDGASTGHGLHLIVDSTGLSIVGEGEWAAAKYGGRGRRGWRKLHLGVDRSGVIIAQALTEGHVDDATTGIRLIKAVAGDLGSVTADAAYDTVGFYAAGGARGAAVVVPPTSTANVSRYGPRSSARDRTIVAVKEMGRRAQARVRQPESSGLLWSTTGPTQTSSLLDGPMAGFNAAARRHVMHGRHDRDRSRRIRRSPSRVTARDPRRSFRTRSVR